MKYETTQKEVRNRFVNVISVGYCNLQFLLRYEQPYAYTANRTEGWRADVYAFGDTAIVTGYGPFGNINPDYEVCKEYDKKAEAIHNEYYYKDFEKEEELLATLTEDFINEVTGKTLNEEIDNEEETGLDR